MSDHSARFKRWPSRLPNHAAYLVDRVEQSVVPILKNAGLVQALPVFLSMATAPAHPPADPSERYVANTLIRMRVPGQQATSSTRFVRPNE